VVVHGLRCSPQTDDREDVHNLALRGGYSLRRRCYCGSALQPLACSVLARRTPLERVDWQGEQVADAAFGLDDARDARVGLQLAPEMQEMEVDASIDDIFMDRERTQQLLARERPLRRLEEGDKQDVLALCQRHEIAVRVDKAMSAALELPAAEPESVPFRDAGTDQTTDLPSQHLGPDTGQKLRHAERLRHLVAGSSLRQTPSSPNQPNQALRGEGCENGLGVFGLPLQLSVTR
jgi:hypothetical protein